MAHVPALRGLHAAGTVVLRGEAQLLVTQLSMCCNAFMQDIPKTWNFQLPSFVPPEPLVTPDVCHFALVMSLALLLGSGSPECRWPQTSIPPAFLDANTSCFFVPANLD